jgi:hypothetical protein
MEQIPFDFHEAREYLISMLAYENQRDELNKAINEARQMAKDKGVPTKACEAAIRAAKGRRKSAISPADFTALMDAAEALMGKD